VAAHVDDLWHVLDEHRTRLHARPTSRAVPQDVVDDDVANEPRLPPCPVRAVAEPFGPSALVAPLLQ
jgi:hypothetical protein